MMEEGEPFTQEELDEMMAAAIDNETGHIPYEYYINQLMASKISRLDNNWDSNNSPTMCIEHLVSDLHEFLSYPMMVQMVGMPMYRVEDLWLES